MKVGFWVIISWVLVLVQVLLGYLTNWSIAFWFFIPYCAILAIYNTYMYIEIKNM